MKKKYNGSLKERRARATAEWRKRYPGQANKNQAAYRKALRKEVLEHYGGAICGCCGETHDAFLSIDHIHGGGVQHRKTLANNGLYPWLRKNKFPPGFRVLCMNCNFAIGKTGTCPHTQIGDNT